MQLLLVAPSILRTAGVLPNCPGSLGTSRQRGQAAYPISGAAATAAAYTAVWWRPELVGGILTLQAMLRPVPAALLQAVAEAPHETAQVLQLDL